MSFRESLVKVLHTEGGYVNHPDDKGGPTNYGITLRTLEAYLGRKVSIYEMQTLNDDIVESIYRKLYWDSLSLDFVSYEKLANAMFDQGINRGPKQIAKEIQKLVGVTMDGAIGPISIKAINNVNGGDLLFEFVKVAQVYYASIVERNPRQAVFLRGWLKRTHKLLEIT